MRVRDALGVVQHDKDPKAKRLGGVRTVLWVGRVRPELAESTDIWLDTSSQKIKAARD